MHDITIDTMSNTHTIFDEIINCHLLDQELLVKIIDDFCSNLVPIDDLFISRFCVAIDHHIISLKNYKYEHSPNSNQYVFGFDFVNHEHTSNSNLQSLLKQHSLQHKYIKYCQYLNKMVFHIIIYHKEFDQLSVYPEKLAPKFQEQLLILRFVIPYEFVSIKYSLQTYSSNIYYYSTDDLIEFLKFSLFDFKINIHFDHFRNIIDKIITNEKDIDNKYLKDLEFLATRALTLEICDKYGNTP